MVRKLNDPSDIAEHPLVNPEMNNGSQQNGYRSYVYMDLLTRVWEKKRTVLIQSLPPGHVDTQKGR